MLREIEIRNVINHCCYVRNCLQEKSSVWNQVCACLDVIEDSMLAAEDYLEKEELSACTQGYIYIYGVLQALFIQQDALNHIVTAINSTFKSDVEKVTDNNRIREIRELRNDVVGHPTKRNKKGEPERYLMLNRHTISKQGFEILFFQKDKSMDPREIKLEQAIKDQVSFVLS